MPEKLNFHIEVIPQNIFNLALSHFAKHKYSLAALIDFLKIINIVFGQTIIPESKFMLFKHIQSNTKPTFHLFCQHCNQHCFTYSPKEDFDENFSCDFCNKTYKTSGADAKFVTFSLESQIKKKLLNFHDKLVFSENDNFSFPIKDVFCGEIHKNIEKTISLTMNTDGVQIFKSSKNSLWPIIVAINNLAPEIRYKKENLIIAGFHFGKHPDMDIYLKDFTDELRSLKANGILIDGERLPVRCLISVLDSAAKYKVLNHKAYNGYYGCPYCYEEGEAVEKTLKYPYQ